MIPRLLAAGWLISQHAGKIFTSIFDAKGQILYQNEDMKSSEIWQKQINVEMLPKGIYFVNIKLGIFSWTQQVIKN